MEYDPFWRARPIQYVLEFAFSLLLAIFSMLAFAMRKVVQTFNDSRSESWPIANGRVIHCDVKTVHGRFIAYTVSRIGYSYEINNAYYFGYLNINLSMNSTHGLS